MTRRELPAAPVPRTPDPAGPPAHPARELLKAVVPAYAVPAAQAYTSGVIIDDPRLRVAALTTIAMSSAAAAAWTAWACWRCDLRWAPDRTAGALRAALVALAASAALAAALVGLAVLAGALPRVALLDAVPAAAAGGAITAAVWARGRRRRIRARATASPGLAAAALLVLVIGGGGGAGAGCGAAPAPRIRSMAAATVVAAERAPDGVSAGVWAGFRAVAAVCGEWSAVADARSHRTRGKQRAAGRIAAIAGNLGTVAGVATGVLAANADRDGDEDRAIRISMIGGIAASAFGIAAMTAGIYGGVQAERTTGAIRVGVDLDHAVSRRALGGLLGAPGARDAAERATDLAIVDGAIGLALECRRIARKLPGLEELPISREADPRTAAVAAILRTSTDDPTAARALEQQVLRGTEAP